MLCEQEIQRSNLHTIWKAKSAQGILNPDKPSDLESNGPYVV